MSPSYALDLYFLFHQLHALLVERKKLLIFMPDEKKRKELESEICVIHHQRIVHAYDH